VYGARPLKRLIQQQIENPLARRILAGEFGPGDEIVVEPSGEGFTFVRRTPAGHAAVAVEA
jgi:ATP-dependent Clp protease ATP-binding subunit ClpB